MAIIGLDLFTERFAEYKDKYVLIGGSACFLNLDRAGFEFRATKDLDIVLILDEKPDPDLTRALWQFIKDAGYEIKQKSDGRPVCYRFTKRKDRSYPYMLELFSRRLPKLDLPDEARLSPLPADDDLTSLSAILLDDDYYNLLIEHRVFKESCPYVTGACLVPLKAKAFLDLKRRKEAGEAIDGMVIKKHKNDVFRLAQILTEDTTADVPGSVRDDLQKFLKSAEAEPPDLKNLDIKNITLADIIRVIKKVYRLDK